MNNQEKKEKAFDDFIDSDVYEKASTAIWELVKAAYDDAWTKGQEAYKGIKAE